MSTTFEWDKVRGIDPKKLRSLKQEKMYEVFDILTLTEDWDVEDKTQEEIIHVFKVFQALLKIKQYELCETHNFLEEVDEEQVRTELQLKAKVEMLKHQLQRISGAEKIKIQDLYTENDRLKGELETYQAELIKSREYIVQEKKHKTRLTNELQEADHKISLLKQNVREGEQTIFDTEEEVRKLNREIKTLEIANSDLKDILISYGCELDTKSGKIIRENCKDFNKYLEEFQVIQNKNEDLQNDKELLTNLLQESERERENITQKYNYVKKQILESDQTFDQLRSEKNAAEADLKILKKDIQLMNEKFDEILAEASEKIEECRSVLFEKQNLISMQQKTISELKQDLQLAKFDGDVNSISVLQQAIIDRDQTIDTLSEQLQEYTKHIEKQVVAFENREKAAKNGSLIQFLESELGAAGKRANSAEKALDQAKAMVEEKDKELLEALGTLRNYVCGTCGLNSAFEEFKKWKHKIKVKDCDMEALTMVINHLEMRIKDLIIENEDLKKKQGAGIKELCSARRRRRIKDEVEKETGEPEKVCLGARQKNKHSPAASQLTLDKNVMQQHSQDSFTVASTNTDEEPRPNQFLHNEISILSKEMENVKQKLHKLEQIWENFKSVEREKIVSGTNTASSSKGLLSSTKQISTLEMEDNKREKTEGGRKANKILSTSPFKLENHNVQLESKVKELTTMGYYDKEVGQKLRNELANKPHGGVGQINSGRIAELEKSEGELRTRVSKLQGECSRFSKKILNLQQDNKKAQEEKKKAEDDRMRAEEKAEELKSNVTELQIIISKLKDKKDAQSTSGSNRKTPEAHLEEMRTKKEMDVQKEEIRYLRSLVAKQDQTIQSLEENIAQQLILQEERQLAEDKLREELEHNQQNYRKVQMELLNCVALLEGDTRPLTNTTLPVSYQVTHALDKIKKHLSSTLDTQATCRLLDEKIKEQKDALKKAENSIFSSKKVINDLCLQLSTVGREQPQADHATFQELTSMSLSSFRQVKETITDLHIQLEKKDDVIKKYIERLDRSLDERKELMHLHQQELAELQHKLCLEKTAGHRYKNQIEQMKQTINDLNEELNVLQVICLESQSDKAGLKYKLTQKETELETVKTLLERSESHQSTAQQQFRDSSVQKQEILVINRQAQRETEELKRQIKNLHEKLDSAEKSVKASRKNEKILRKQVEELTQENQCFQSTQKVIEAERRKFQRETHQLTLQVRKLASATEKLQQSTNGPTVEELQEKIKRIEGEFEHRLKSKTETNKEVIKFEMKKKWQKKVQDLQKTLNEKIEENESLLKKQITLRNLLAKLEKDKRVLQDKMKAQSVSVEKTPCVSGKSTSTLHSPSTKP